LNNLDLRVREIHQWGNHFHADLAVHFDTDRKTIQSRAQLDNSGWIFGQVWSSHQRYTWEHVEEFERVLREEMGKDREPARGKKGHGIVGVDFSSSGCVDVQTSGQTGLDRRSRRRMRRVSQGRVLKKTRSMPERRAKQPAKRTAG